MALKKLTFLSDRFLLTPITTHIKFFLRWRVLCCPFKEKKPITHELKALLMSSTCYWLTDLKCLLKQWCFRQLKIGWGNKGVSLTAVHPGKLRRLKTKKKCTHCCFRKKKNGGGKESWKKSTCFFLPLSIFKLYVCLFVFPLKAR